MHNSLVSCIYWKISAIIIKNVIHLVYFNDKNIRGMLFIKILLPYLTAGMADHVLLVVFRALCGNKAWWILGCLLYASYLDLLVLGGYPPLWGYPQWPLLTWIDFNSDMITWNWLSIPKFQWLQSMEFGDGLVISFHTLMCVLLQVCRDAIHIGTVLRLK